MKTATFITLVAALAAVALIPSCAAAFDVGPGWDLGGVGSTPSPTVSVSPTPTPNATNNPTPVPTEILSPSASPTPTSMPSASPSPTPTVPEVSVPMLIFLMVILIVGVLLLRKGNSFKHPSSLHV